MGLLDDVLGQAMGKQSGGSENRQMRDGGICGKHRSGVAADAEEGGAGEVHDTRITELHVQA